MRPATAPWLAWRPGATFDLVFLEGTESALRPLLDEAGGHRWQRVPPTERKGRVHTSTVTVAAFEGHMEPQKRVELNPRDIHERITTGTGPGGQNRNRRATCLVITHLPTGIEVKAEAERTQEGNRRVAMTTLRERVAEHFASAEKKHLAENRKAQVGTGQRGDKVRTYRSDGVTDHRTARKAPLASIEAGKLELLWA